jgi:2-(1,2-epoxy-1,2-dihydrophenyl)acetyl-CoA isomerase
MGDAELVLVERDGPVVELILNRPERKNAIVQGLAVALRDAIKTASTDPEVGAIVLRGAGGAFCSGMDLKVSGPDLKNEPVTAWTEVHAALYRCPVPVVVALERFAINAGAALALGADLVVAGESSFLEVSEVRFGVAAPMCQAWLHLRHSPAVADRVTLLGDRIAAPEALRLGLVTEVVADDRVIDRARELAATIAGHPVAGRRGIAAMWGRLRPPIEDPDQWFASLAGR